MIKKHKDESQEKNEELEKCLAEREEYLAGWKRANADLANYKKEEQMRQKEFIEFANAQLVKDMLAILDSFERATDLSEGAQRIKQQLEETLKRQGVESIEVKAGDLFDPARHEALLSAESEHATDTVLEELEKGYMLYGKVIRAAKVKISK